MYSLSPILFNIVADLLLILIKRGKDNHQIRGVIPHHVDDGLSILQYKDDTILFLDHDIEQAKKMKPLLFLFEQLSGLNINFHKSEFFVLEKKIFFSTTILNFFLLQSRVIPFEVFWHTYAFPQTP